MRVLKAMALGACLVAAGSAGAGELKLPGQLTWTAYGTGIGRL